MTETEQTVITMNCPLAEGAKILAALNDAIGYRRERGDDDQAVTYLGLLTAITEIGRRNPAEPAGSCTLSSSPSGADENAHRALAEDLRQADDAEEGTPP